MSGEDLNPQHAQMADESMIRTLAFQAEAIWPQERSLFARYQLSGDLAILDGGCGTGEITFRLGELYPRATVLGVDIIEEHLVRARQRSAALGPRIRFEKRSLFELELPAASFDLAVCRHVLQSIPHADRVVAELARVTRPGGWLHLIAEDYGMLHFAERAGAYVDFWHQAPVEFERATGTDLHIGRHVAPLLARLGLRDIALDYLVVDTLRVPRPTFAAILEAWRDGYVAAIAEKTSIPRAIGSAQFEQMIATVLDPDSYAAWFVPVASARVP